MPFIISAANRQPIDQARATFDTHLNYIRRMSLITNNMTVEIPRLDSAPLNADKAAKFEKLAEITMRNIVAERDACAEESAYALIAAPWISAKCYYALYYLEAVFLYYLEGSEVGFSNGGHAGVRKAITRHIKNGRIKLGGCEHADDLGTVVTWQAATGFRTTGSTISATYYTEADCSGSVRKKVAEYIEVDWKRSRGITAYRSNRHKAMRDTELHPKEFTILDYFYWWRIKTHYRDLDFLNFGGSISEDDAVQYTFQYVSATRHYARALQAAIEVVKTGRGMGNQPAS